MSYVKDLLASPRDEASYSGVWFGIVTTDIFSSSDPVRVIIPALSDTQEFGPCDWSPRSISTGGGSALDGPSGTLASAELDGSGRTTLIADGLSAGLISLPDEISVELVTDGISVVVSDHYLIQFVRPSPDGQYALEWFVPGFDSPFLEIFQVGPTSESPINFPKRGDPCRIIFDNNRSPFLIWWEPASA